MEWIRRGQLIENEPKAAPSSAYPSASDPRSTTDGQDPELIEKLRSLGYIE